MANTYTQMHHQFVFAVQNRLSLIDPVWKHELYKYITGIIQHHDHKMLAINGMPDHIHIFVGMRPTQSVANLLHDIKGCSSKWINENRLTKGIFKWQEGYGAFSYSKSHVQAVINYILNQEIHHKKKTFIEEYIDFLEHFGVEYDRRYIFKPVE
jgi:REP element-mobilizing transposase RayT